MKHRTKHAVNILSKFNFIDTATHRGKGVVNQQFGS